jgi:hypothetical protein
MSDDRLGHGVPVMGVCVYDPLLHEVAKAALPHAIEETLWEITTELIDIDLQDELRMRCGSLESKTWRDAQECNRYRDDSRKPDSHRIPLF